MALIGEIAVNIVARTGQFTKGLNAVRKNLQSAGRAFLGFGGTVSAGFAVAIKRASDFEETMSKFNTVFEESAKTVQAWSENFAQQVGRSRNQIAGMLASTQDLFVPMGFAADEALELSKNMTKLAVDLGSFNNVSDDVAILDLHRALTGGGEVMKKYGVVLDEVTTKQELLNMKLDPTTATTYEKVQARLAIVMRGTSKAQGDAIRTSSGFANQLKRVRGNLDDMAVTIGNAVLPAITEIVSKTSEMAISFGKWAQRNAELVKSLGAVGFASLALGFTFSGLAIAVGGLTTALRAFSSALLFVTRHPLVLLATLLGAAAIAILEIVGALDWLQRKLGTVADKMAGGESPIAKIAADAQKAAAEVGKLTTETEKLGNTFTEVIRRRISGKSKGRGLAELQGSAEWLRQVVESREATARLPGQVASQKFLAQTEAFKNRLRQLEQDIHFERLARRDEIDRFNRRPGNQFTQAARRGIHGAVESIFGGRTGASGLVQSPIFGKIAKVIESIGKIPIELEEVVRSQNSIIQRGSQEAIAFARQHERRGTENDPGKQTAKNTKEMVKGINGVKEAVNEVAKAIGREPVFSIPAS